MAPYMYTSVTGANWDDDDADFEPGVCSSAAAKFTASKVAKSTLADARVALETFESGLEYDNDDEEEPMYPSDDTPTRCQMDYNIDPEDAPTYADYMTELWSTDHHRRPAYIPLSFEYGRVHREQRRNYSANWKATKLRMGANMRHTMMMAPSSLRMCKTWVSDAAGECVEETTYEGFALGRMLQVRTPRLVFGSESESESEGDEAFTPPGSPLRQEEKCGVETEEHDPITGGIDLPAHSIEAMKAEMGREFTGLSSIAEDLNVHQIFGDAERVAGDSDLIEPAQRADVLLSTSSKAQSSYGVAITTAEAILAASPPTEATTGIAVAGSMQLSRSKDDTIAPPVDSVSRNQAQLQVPSPDLKYIVDPTNNTLVWNTVAVGWFAISSLPWTRIAVTAAGAVVDVAICVVRH